MFKKYNIAKPEKYTNNQGQVKTMWHNVGTITEFYKQDGSVSRIVEIPAIGLNANAFLQEPKQQSNSAPEAQNRPLQQSSKESSDNIPIIQENDYNAELNEIDTKNIPF